MLGDEAESQFGGEVCVFVFQRTRIDRIISKT